MSRSTRFPAAVHILTLLAVRRGEYLSSEWIAKSLRTNAVVVRRILGQLQAAGLVESRTGSQGGTRLTTSADKISLLDIYEAVEDQSVFALHDPHPKCPVASSVREKVASLVEQAEAAMKRQLAKTRLGSISKPALRQLTARSRK